MSQTSCHFQGVLERSAPEVWCCMRNVKMINRFYIRIQHHFCEVRTLCACRTRRSRRRSERDPSGEVAAAAGGPLHKRGHTPVHPVPRTAGGQRIHTAAASLSAGFTARRPHWLETMAGGAPPDSGSRRTPPVRPVLFCWKGSRDSTSTSASCGCRAGSPGAGARGRWRGSGDAVGGRRACRL